MSLPNSSNRAASNAQRSVEANGTNSNDPAFSRIIPAKDKRIKIFSADGKKLINGNEGFLDKLAYHMDGPLEVNSNEYVRNYKCLTKSLRYFGQPTTITYQDARSPVRGVKMYKNGTLKVPIVFPFFISKSCSNPRTMVFNIKDMCYILGPGVSFAEPTVETIRKALGTIVSDFKRFTSNQNGTMNPICRQKVKIVNNYDAFPFSKVIVLENGMISAGARLFLSDSIIKSYNVEQIEELLEELLRFIEVSEEGKQLPKFENFKVELSIMTLSNGPQEYHFHSGKNYDMSAEKLNELEISVEDTLRDIVLGGYSGLNAHPFDLCRGVVMVPSIQNFKLVTTSEKKEQKNSSRKLGQPPPYNQ